MPPIPNTPRAADSTSPSTVHTDPRLAQLERRLDLLTRANRRWRHAACILAGVGAIALAAGVGTALSSQPATQETVAANRVLILNQDGLPVVTLSSRAGSGWIRLADAFGQTRGELTIDRRDNTALTLFRADGTEGVRVLAGEGIASIQALDPDGNPLGNFDEPGRPVRGPAAEPFAIDDPREADPREAGPREADPGVRTEPAPERASERDPLMDIPGHTYRLDRARFADAYETWVEERPERATDDPESDLAEFEAMFEDRSIDLTINLDGTWQALSADTSGFENTASGDWSFIAGQIELRVLTDRGEPDPDEPAVRLRPYDGRTVLLLMPEGEYMPHLPLTRD